MSRPCSGCGLKWCDGRCFQGECHLESDTPEEVAAPRKPYVPSPEYLAWLEEIDGGPDPLKHLEPRRAA